MLPLVAGTGLTTGMLVVFAVILAALVLFVTEPVPIDITAIGVLVSLVVLEPWTRVTPADGLSGFASPATVTVLAMFVLSEGVRRTGVVNRVGRAIADRFGDSQFGQLAAVLGLAGGTAGFVNNTPVVAVMIPMVSSLSERTGVSPSKLLIPVSYVSMMGGMLTLIGTSSNILASDVYDRVGGAATEPFSMFEFSALGPLVLATGTAYLLAFGPRRLPERIAAGDDLTDEFGMAEYLTEAVVREDSPLVGLSAETALAGVGFDRHRPAGPRRPGVQRAAVPQGDPQRRRARLPDGPREHREAARRRGARARPRRRGDRRAAGGRR